jgi:hypothetical protein
MIRHQGSVFLRGFREDERTRGFMRPKKGHMREAIDFAVKGDIVFLAATVGGVFELDPFMPLNGYTTGWILTTLSVASLTRLLKACWIPTGYKSFDGFDQHAYAGAACPLQGAATANLVDVIWSFVLWSGQWWSGATHARPSAGHARDNQFFS